MSFRALNTPSIVTATGVAIAGIAPFIEDALPTGALQAANVLAFCTNVVAVSVPGRLDGKKQVDASKKRGKGDKSKTNSDDPIFNRGRTLLMPAGWAFAIWGPIYLGEAIFCFAQIFDPSLAASLPVVTGPFVAANLFQSLWCASFRPSYNEGWHKYVSAAMLGGTAMSLLAIPPEPSIYFVPLMMHFGWTTAATLVNLNGSLSMSANLSDSELVAAGHFSTVLATALGAGLTLAEGITTPVYGMTIAWALAAVAKGVSSQNWSSETLKKGAKVQSALCWVGSALCLAVSAFVTIEYALVLYAI